MFQNYQLTTSTETNPVSYPSILKLVLIMFNMCGFVLFLQIPGKLLFSLVKRYLCVTSLMDKLNTAGTESSSERQDPSPSPATSSTSVHQMDLVRLQKEFDFTMAMANLISELVRVMGWDRNRQPPDGYTHHTVGGEACARKEELENLCRPVLRSIFQPRFCTSPITLSTSSPTTAPSATPSKKKAGNGFKTRSDFASRSAYVEYVQDNLKSGMMVRMLEDYEEVSGGDEGEFRYSNDGSPPVQVRTGLVWLTGAGGMLLGLKRRHK